MSFIIVLYDELFDKIDDLNWTTTDQNEIFDDNF